MTKSEVSPCNAKFPPELLAFGSAISELMLREARRANRLIRSGIGCFPPPAYAKFAVNWISDHGYVVAQPDKDGTFVLGKRVVVRALVEKELLSASYRSVSVLSLDAEHRRICSTASRLAYRFERLADGNLQWQRWARQLKRSSCIDDVSKLITPISWTIKTHKLVGKLAARLLHCSFAHPLSAFSQLFNLLSTPILTNLQHMCSSTDAAQKLIAAARVGPKSCLVKIDIKSFFLAGEHDSLIAACAASFDDGVRGFVTDLLWLLCSSQFIAADWIDALFTNKLGSGMGSRHSGNFANLAFYRLVELRFVHNLGHHSIQLYLRFFDDNFICFATASKARKFIKYLHNIAQPHYELEVYGASLVSVEFLDIVVHKIPKGFGAALSWTPYVKPTAVHLPLHHESQHPVHVHKSWIMSETRRMAARSRTWDVFHHHRLLKVNRWQYLCH